MATDLRKPSKGRPPQKRVYSTPLSRALKPVSLRDLAEAAGVSYGYVAKIARAAKPCPPRVRLVIEEFFGDDWWKVVGFKRDPDPHWDGTADGDWVRAVPDLG